MTTSSTSARLRPFRPQAFGRYTLLSHLATGGMGEIYLARLEGVQGFEKLCVIKKILPQLAEDKEFVDRFVGEARTLVKLHHGSIAQVLDMGLHEGDAYMALEYVDGKDLRKVAGRVRDKGVPLPLTFVLFVMGRVLDALAYAHRKRDDDEKEIHLVHRDISPQNILISYEGEVKVIDFGLAKSRLSAAKTNPSIILGKFLYMSPEQARHQQVDRRSDLYAVGLCLYELIAGKNPFDSVHSGELMSAVASPRIVPLNEVEPFTPPAVTQLVMKALAVEPAQRFQTAEEFRGRLISVLMEIDPSAGPESVSRFMRDLFAAEFQSERKLLAQLKEAPKHGELPPRSELDTDPGARFPAPSLPPKTINLDPPSQPLSFQPTPRSRPGVSVHEEETRPGVMPPETRPAVSFEALDAQARARVRPSVSSTSPTADTVTVEVRTDPTTSRPVPSVATPAPASTRAAAPTLEVPIPYVPPAAIPPGPAPSASTPGTTRTLEAPRASVPPPPPVSPPAPKPMEPPRGAMPPPPPPGSAPPPRVGEVPRVGPPPVPPAGAAAPRGMEPPRAPMPPPPPAHESRGPEVARSQSPTIQNPVFAEAPAASGSSTASQPPPAPLITPPDPIAAVDDSAPPPVPEEELATGSPAAHAGPSREWSRGSTGARAASADPGVATPRSPEPSTTLAPESVEAPPEPSRRGLDDTHPSYLMASAKPPEDTQPRVVLDEAAFPGQQDSEGQVIVSGVLEESSPSRPRTGRRPRPSATGMQTVGRGTSPGTRSAARPARAGEDAEARPEQDDSEPVHIEIEDGGEAPERDPREDTRKTPVPTRPGEKRGRAQREDPRRAAAVAPERKRSVTWIVVTFLLLVVAGAAAVVGLPRLEHLWKQWQEPETRPTPAMPIPRVPPPSGPPGMGPPGAPPAAAAAGTGGKPAAETPAGTAPTPAPGAAAPQTTEAASPADDIFVPLPNAPASAATPKKTPPRSSKKAVRSKDSAELQKEWAQARGFYSKLTQEQSCESPKLGLLCSKYEALKVDMAELGDGYDKDIHDRVKKMRKSLQQLLLANP